MVSCLLSLYILSFLERILLYIKEPIHFKADPFFRRGVKYFDGVTSLESVSIPLNVIIGATCGY